jgi:hypothetical protein
VEGLAVEAEAAGRAGLAGRRAVISNDDFEEYWRFLLQHHPDGVAAHGHAVDDVLRLGVAGNPHREVTSCVNRGPRAWPPQARR